jgi:hypothetical protein
MKLLVETTGEFQLCGPGPEQFARYNRPSVVTPSTFFDTHTAKGVVKVLGQLSDDASDEEFAAKPDVKAYLASHAWVDPDAKQAKAPKVATPPAT